MLGHHGKSTNLSYKGATVFVDYHSSFKCVHLMTEMNANTTVEAKQAFKGLAASHNVSIKHFHHNKVLFQTKTFQAWGGKGRTKTNIVQSKCPSSEWKSRSTNQGHHNLSKNGSGACSKLCKQSTPIFKNSLPFHKFWVRSNNFALSFCTPVSTIP